MMIPHFAVRAWPAILAVFAASSSSTLAGRTGSAVPPLVADSGDVALALSAAPASVSGGASVYLLRGDKFTKVRDGTNGFSCLVNRDPRNNSVSPECFDPEAARTLMQEEMMEGQLVARGLSNEAVEREVNAAYKRGALHYPEHGGVIYMMSSKQMLPPSPEASQPLSAWHPHVMIYIPHASKAQFALGADNDAMPVSAPFKGDDQGVLRVVQVPHWADSQAMVDASADHR